MSKITREQAYRRWKKGEDPHKLAKEMGTTRERMRHILEKLDASVPLVDRIEELEAKLSKSEALLAKAVEAERVYCAKVVKHCYDNGCYTKPDDISNRTTRAELKGQDDE